MCDLIRRKFASHQSSRIRQEFLIFFQPELFNEIRTLTAIRNETNNRIQQLNHYEEMKQKLQDVGEQKNSIEFSRIFLY